LMIWSTTSAFLLAVHRGTFGSMHFPSILDYTWSSFRGERYRRTMEQTVTGKPASKYRGSKVRKDRIRILDKVKDFTCCSRHYAAWLLRNHGKRRLVRNGCGETVELRVGRNNERRHTERLSSSGSALISRAANDWRRCFPLFCPCRHGGTDVERSTDQTTSGGKSQ
jgi:hypothetical protein